MPQLASDVSTSLMTVFQNDPQRGLWQNLLRTYKWFVVEWT